MWVKLSKIGVASAIGLGLVVGVSRPAPTPTAYAADVRLAATTALIMGGANGGGTIGYGIMAAVLNGRYVNDNMVCVSWPAEIAGFYGTTTLGDSIAIGTDSLDVAIREQYKTDPNGKVIAVGLSQASEVLDAELTRLAAARAAGDTTAPPPDKLDFVVIGDSDRGLLNWFKGVPLPLFDYTPQGIPVTPYNVTVVKGEYDGFGDPPERWWNLLAMFNAAAGTGFFAGFGSVHYGALWADLNTVPKENITTTVNLAGGVTTTYLVPTPDLPMLRPLKDMGVPQDVIDNLEKVLRPIIDSAYVRNDPGRPRPTLRTGAAEVTAASSSGAVTTSIPVTATARSSASLRPTPTSAAARPRAVARPTAASSSDAAKTSDKAGKRQTSDSRRPTSSTTD
jgi:hypothetical protein